MLSDKYIILLAFGCSFIITYLAIPKIIHFANKLRLHDNPGERASHKGRIPVFGGVAIFSGIIFSLLLGIACSYGSATESIIAEKTNLILFVLVSLIIVFFLGIIDDLLSLSPFRKLLGQILSVLIIIYLADIRIENMHAVLGFNEPLSNSASTLFTIFTVIVIINGYNLIDGIDGLAAGIGIIAGISFGWLSYINQEFHFVIISSALVGSLIAFLRFNFHPARIFMGDTGSLVIGLILSVLAINQVDAGIVNTTPSYPHKGPLLAIGILAIPLFDSLRVFILRVLKKKNPLSPDRNHFHHTLLDLGFNHRSTTFVIYIITILILVLTYFLINVNINYGITIIALVNFLILIIPFIILRNKK